jgi:hypothetical protein
METVDLQYDIFVVDETPYCLWDKDIKVLALDFLNNFDPTYFEYLANINFEQFRNSTDETTKHHSALAIRTTFSQGLETLFALMFGLIQAPNCIPGWLNTYFPKNIKSLIKKINTHKPILSRLSSETVSWTTISEAVHEPLQIDDLVKQERIKTEFANLWATFAKFYLEQSFDEEYNSIKHGLRVRSGGFSFAFGKEDEPGKKAVKSKMRLVGESEYGSQFLRTEKIGSNKSLHLKIKHSSRNWSPEDMVWGIHLISMSLLNILSTLKILNGIEAHDVEYTWPENSDAFKETWKRTISLGVTSASVNINIDKLHIENFSKEDLLVKYKEGRTRGIRRFTFKEDHDGN